jgi:hypothetical protein
MSKDPQPFIQLLQSKNFKAEYPTCNGKMDLSETALFDAEHFTAKAKDLLKQQELFNNERKEELTGRLGKMSQKINVKASFHQKGLNVNFTKYNTYLNG